MMIPKKQEFTEKNKIGRIVIDFYENGVSYSITALNKNEVTVHQILGAIEYTKQAIIMNQYRENILSLPKPEYD